MIELSIPVMAAWVNAGALFAAGLANLVGFPKLREIYADWDIPAGLYSTIGIAEIVAAVFLATPGLRLWGILIAAAIMFFSVVILLDHQHYAYAAPVALLMVALVTATLAVPSVGAEMRPHFIPNMAAHERAAGDASARRP